MHLLPASQLRGIDSDEQRLNTALLSMLHDALRDLAILVNIQLKELDLIRLSRIDKFVKRARRKSGYLQGG